MGRAQTPEGLKDRGARIEAGAAGGSQARGHAEVQRHQTRRQSRVSSSGALVRDCINTLTSYIAPNPKPLSPRRGVFGPEQGLG